MTGLRVAVPPALQTAAAAAVPALGPVRVICPAPPRPERLEWRWQRLLRERGGHRSAAELDAARQDGSVRAVLALLDHEADAALLSESDPAWRLGWELLEPARAASGTLALPGTDVWIGSTAHGTGPGGGMGTAFGWLEWANGTTTSAAVDRLRSAAASVGRATGRVAVPVVVNFSGGPSPVQAATQRFRRTLAERTTASMLDLYSPLFYAEGRLQASALVAAVQRSLAPSAIAVLCCPQLEGADVAASLENAGGRWAGPFRAGAEHPMARCATGLSQAQVTATLAWLLRWQG